MRIVFTENVSGEWINATLEEFNTIPNLQAIMVLVADNLYPHMEEFLSIFKTYRVEIFGALFPEIVYMNRNYDKGMIMVAFESPVHIVKVNDMNDTLDELDKKIDDDYNAFNTILAFVDGFSKNISQLIDGLYNLFGLNYNFIGGGAGSLSLVQRPCLFTRDDFFHDGAIIVLLENKSSIGISHGWEVLAGPLKVTESDGKIVKSLNSHPAFSVYKEIIKEITNDVLNEDSFYDIAKKYPFGLSTLGNETIVRDPFRVIDGKYIECFGDVPLGAYIYILSGENASLIASAKKAFDQCNKDIQDGDHKCFLFIDCISRALFLGDDIIQEMNIVSQPNVPMLGVLSIGEICNNGKKYLEFYNKTIVVGAF